MAPLRRCTALLIWLTVFLVAPAAAAFKYVEVGQEAPQFSLQTLEGETVSLKDQRDAKVLAVVFWATWSPRSKPMLDDLEILYQEHRDKGFGVVAVNVEHEEITAADRSAIAELGAGWSFPVLLDEGLSTYYQYGVVATPTLALLEATGAVRYVRASYSSSAKQEIRETVEGLLGLAEDKTAAVTVRKRDYVPPKKATLHYQKAEVLIARGRPKRAIKDLEEASAIDPKWAQPRVLLAEIYRAEAGAKPELLEKAEGLLREAREIQPRHLQTLVSLAEVLVVVGKSREALEIAGEALEIEPAYTPALLARARSLRVLGRLEEAAATVDEAVELAPRSPEVLAEQGELAATQGRFEDAAGSLRKAVEYALAAARGS